MTPEMFAPGNNLVSKNSANFVLYNDGDEQDRTATTKNFKPRYHETGLQIHGKGEGNYHWSDTGIVEK